jgi:hypothetical protein
MKYRISLGALALGIAACPAYAQSNDDEKRPETALEIARELGVSGDDVRPENQRQIMLFGKPLIIGGEIGAAAQYRSDYELVDGADDDDVGIDSEAKLEAIWSLSEDTVVFASGKAFAETEVYKQGGGADQKAGFELDEAWILKTGIGGTDFAVQLGRQQIQDRREWWWDEDLDAFRIHYFGNKLRGFAGIGREFGYKSTLGRFDPEDKGIVRIFGTATWEWSDRQEIGPVIINQRDTSRRFAVNDLVDAERRDESEAKLTWMGLRGRGRVKADFPGKFYYWFELARVSGSVLDYDFATFDTTRDVVTAATRTKVRGWAYDVGLSLELPFEFKPYLTLGYARGSGDASPGGRDGAFRQTGLQNNNGKYRGLSRFRYYGEVLRPELSNLAVSTVALGVPFGKFAWLETIWHNYRQPVAADRIRGSRLDIEPTGLNRRLGDEFDMVFSLRPNQAWEFEFTAGAFRAGPAFGTEKGKWAGIAQIKIDFNF